jgi:hypothetical protein
MRPLRNRDADTPAQPWTRARQLMSLMLPPQTTIEADELR